MTKETEMDTGPTGPALDDVMLVQFGATEEEPERLLISKLIDLPSYSVPLTEPITGEPVCKRLATPCPESKPSEIGGPAFDFSDGKSPGWLRAAPPDAQKAIWKQLGDGQLHNPKKLPPNALLLTAPKGRLPKVISKEKHWAFRGEPSWKQDYLVVSLPKSDQEPVTGDPPTSCWVEVECPEQGLQEIVKRVRELILERDGQ